MKHHTIEATYSKNRWTFVTYSGQPAPTLWKQAASRWYFYRHSHSFSVMAQTDALPHEIASVAVDHFFRPTTDREYVDLARFNIETRGHKIGQKK